jgi:hypothetical protein
MIIPLTNHQVRVERDQEDPCTWLVITPKGMAWDYVCSTAAKNEADVIAKGFGYGVRVHR